MLASSVTGAITNSAIWGFALHKINIMARLPRTQHAGAVDPANGELTFEEVWTEPIDRLLTELATTRAGLDAAGVQMLLTRYGFNTATAAKFLARRRLLNRVMQARLEQRGLTGRVRIVVRDHCDLN